ncbi:hypothetical protein KMW28_00885 [Flammeovirga yaeyamensis]|uniref:Periplasmic heavy metal sensor n=1 Tax=Flammeovirga yaeyamensis TaxID=367791 RepID=A0AAX1N3N6_9BACT|nr:hypothetical protein [Flammeovirga yaeyamensis]MBB3699638.1 hypothetical protein [Flammeovirga yaeyamensis]NMF36791.1 hypothetical protein [Flammeovirga yaeyamensis]QWG02170.1 hypothetical protein KMW28_00885 [Flammeovirga yaeyamensis]
MKRYSTTLLILMLSITVYGQRGPRFFMKGPQELPSELVEELQFDDTEKKKVNKAFMKFQEDVMTMMMLAREEGEVDRDEMKKESDKLKLKHLEKVKDLLDDQKYEQYKTFVLMEMREQQQYILELKLKLTPDQKEKYDAITASSKATFTQLREQFEGDREGMREAMQKVQKQQMMMLSSVLTEKQMTIYKESMQQRRGKRQ